MLLEVEQLTVRTDGRPILEKLDFSLRAGEILGLVGESGSGKSMTARAIMGLLPEDIQRSGGTIRFEGQNMDALPPERRRRMLGRDLAMVFQDPMTSLNPLYTVEHQLAEALRVHRPDLSRAEVRALCIRRLTEVEIRDPASAMRMFPHQFSGGQRQRICIAMALMNRPKLLIADEVTTALDVTVQYRILELLRSFRRKYGMGLLVVSHNLALIKHLCDRVLVLYAGRNLEEGTVKEVLNTPRHPYTAELLAAVPENAVKGRAIATIPGQVPSLYEPRPLCPFYDRCRYALPSCLSEALCVQSYSASHRVFCARSDAMPELIRARQRRTMHEGSGARA